MDDWFYQFFVKEDEFAFQTIFIMKKSRWYQGKTWGVLMEYWIKRFEECASLLQERKYKDEKLIEPEKLVVLSVELKGRKEKEFRESLQKLIVLYD